MSRSHKDFVAMIELGEGDHEYKFLVDGQWITDPNAATIENNAGFKNNIIHVQREDFDAFEALDMDMATVTKAQSHKAAKANQVKPQDKFGQEMPHLVNTSGIPISGSGGTGSESRSSGPPILPPHLLQVILNKVRFFIDYPMQGHVEGFANFHVNLNLQFDFLPQNIPYVFI